MIKILCTTDTRVSKVSNIRVDNVCLNTGLIRAMSKHGKSRYIQIASPDILDILKSDYNSEYI